MNAPEILRTQRVGVWTGALDALPATRLAEVGAQLEELGYGSLWFGEAYGGEALTTAAALAVGTRSMVIATGIANIYARGPMATAAGARTVGALADGRFVLGLGVSHGPLVERDRKVTYRPPLAAMAEYLDGLEQAPYFGANPEMPPVVLAALGPRMLRLAAERTAGAHPYLVTPAHTRQARETLGPDPLLVVEQAAVVNQGPEEARRRAHDYLTIYTGLPNYRNNWLREGFTEDDLVKGGSERLARAMVAIGDEGAVRERVDEHLEAGADHVCVQVLGADFTEVPVAEWTALAPALTSR